MNLFDLLGIIGKSLDGSYNGVPAAEGLTLEQQVVLTCVVELSGTLITKVGRGEPDVSVQTTLLE